MSNMIKCDGCEKLMYADSRSEKGAYYEFWINQYDRYHLCHECYTKFMNTILHMYWDEEEGEFVEKVGFYWDPQKGEFVERVCSGQQ